MVNFETLYQHLLGVFVGYVTNHNGRAAIGLDVVYVYAKCISFLGTNNPPISAWFLGIIVAFMNMRHHRVVGMNLAQRSLGDWTRGVLWWNVVWAGLGVLANDLQTGVDNGLNHLILLVALRRFTMLFRLMDAVHTSLISVLILKKKYRVIKDILATRSRLASIAPWDT